MLAYITESSALSELGAALPRQDRGSFAVLGKCKGVVVHYGTCTQDTKAEGHLVLIDIVSQED